MKQIETIKCIIYKCVKKLEDETGKLEWVKKEPTYVSLHVIYIIEWFESSMCRSEFNHFVVFKLNKKYFYVRL